MATTTHFGWELLDSGAAGWDAVLNGVLVDVDRTLKEFTNPLTHEDELLLYDGAIMGYAD